MEKHVLNRICPAAWRVVMLATLAMPALAQKPTLVLDVNRLVESAPPSIGTPQSRPAPPLTPTASQVLLLDEVTDSGPAVGKPTDPLQPDANLQLDEAAAKQDLWVRVRKGFAMPELEGPLVSEHERWYSSRPDYVQRMTERGSRYLFHVVAEIERRQMPTELALLPFIESAFNPQAQSSASASGIWQFMPATGKDFALKQNMFRDDRRDVLASTRAALDYLQRLYRQFGDWQLALAAYNWGEGNVQKAMARNTRLGLPTDYQSLNMPLETRHYVPKLYAVRHIVAQPQDFNLTLPAVKNHPYFVSVPIQRDIDADLAARLAGMSLDEFKTLNPSQNKPVILAAGTPQLLLPYDNASQFVSKLNAHKGRLASWTAWVVPRTMRPTEAGKQLNMSEAALRDINHIPPKMLIKAGSTLLVHRTEQRANDVSVALADNATMSLAPDVPPLRRMVIKAGRQDSVRTVSARYKVTPQQLAQWNRVGAAASFQRGQSIVLYVPASAGKAKTPSAPVMAQQNKGRQARGTRVAMASPARSNASRTAAKPRPAPSVNRGKIRVASAR